jgi:hypothetical protein
VPDPCRDQITQLTASDLDGYEHQPIRCLKALSTAAPIRVHVQDELIAVRAEQRARTASDGPRRHHELTGLHPGDGSEESIHALGGG